MQDITSHIFWFLIVIHYFNVQQVQARSFSKTKWVIFPSLDWRSGRRVLSWKDEGPRKNETHWPNAEKFSNSCWEVA
jgi:hypothetical protein